MFAASIVAKIRPGPSLRPATKKSLLWRTSRAVHRPSATTATEYTTSSRRWMDIYWRGVPQRPRVILLRGQLPAPSSQLPAATGGHKLELPAGSGKLEAGSEKLVACSD